MRRFKLAAIAFLVMLLPVMTVPASASDINGYWEGAIDLPAGGMKILLQFNQNQGIWSGKISIPAQNARDLPLEKIALQEETWTWAITGIPGNPTFRGSLNPVGDNIKGTFSQGGANFPFSLQRSANPVQSGKAALSDLDALVQRGLKELDVPGVALAVVKDNEVLLAKGYGLRDLEQKLPMTENTLLAIGSSSKAFTTFALGIMSDRGFLEWDQPLRNYIPWFSLQDRTMGERISPRDLVTHRSGLPRHDLVWYNNHLLSREELVRRLAHLEPTADLRARFQYNNLMFLTAGYLLETLTGQSWEESIRELVFDPLGMKRSNCSVNESQKDKDHALPYTFRDGRITSIPFRNIDTVGPAGAINSSVSDMSRWLLTQLGGGRLDGEKLLNPSTLADMHTPHMPLDGESAEPLIQNVGYGLGWFIDVYRGHRRIHHGGAIDGFICQVAFLPQEGIGIVALANMNGTGLPELLTRCISDRLLGLEARDWIGEAAQRRAVGLKAGQEAQEKGRSRRILKTRPAHSPAEYSGTYHHPGYGDLVVTARGKELEFCYNAIRTPLEHWHYETFNGMKAKDTAFEDFKLTFGCDENGRVSWLEGQFEPTLDPIRFRKKADARFFDPAFLKQLAGRYELPGQIVSIVFKGQSLAAVLPGQPEYDMIPLPGDEFTFKQARVVTLRFLNGVKGEVTGLEFHQGGAVFTARRLPEKKTE